MWSGSPFAGPSWSSLDALVGSVATSTSAQASAASGTTTVSAAASSVALAQVSISDGVVLVAGVAVTIGSPQQDAIVGVDLLSDPVHGGGVLGIPDVRLTVRQVPYVRVQAVPL